jgi:predicted cupin superfamily sugar epimerase
MLTNDDIKALLGLRPHPTEGGFYVETYRSQEVLSGDSPPARYRGPRAFGTAIYYLITPDSFSAMHCLPTDEIFHFYLGDPVEMLQLSADGGGKLLYIGTDIASGQRPQVIVPKDVWQGSRLVAGGRFALLGATMAPGFDFADYQTGKRQELIGRYPDFRDLITSLTRG